jgi:hypothetical protein
MNRPATSHLQTLLTILIRMSLDRPDTTLCLKRPGIYQPPITLLDMPILTSLILRLPRMYGLQDLLSILYPASPHGWNIST